MLGNSLLATLMLLCVSGIWTLTSAKGTKIDVSRADNERKSRFISFDTNSGKIDVSFVVVRNKRIKFRILSKLD